MPVNTVYEPVPGETVLHAATEMVLLANQHRETVRAKFNDIDITAEPAENPHAIVRRYNAECEQRRQEYLRSPEYREYQQRAREQELQKELALQLALLEAPQRMTLRDEEGWEKPVSVNSDGGYGEAVIRYAETWARIMEARMASGSTIGECADEASHVADNEGITDFQYGCAVSILSQVWIHGEELRRWHNLKTQIGDEGERANKTGAVLNPALLSVGKVL